MKTGPACTGARRDRSRLVTGPRRPSPGIARPNDVRGRRDTHGAADERIVSIDEAPPDLADEGSEGAVLLAENCRTKRKAASLGGFPRERTTGVEPATSGLGSPRSAS